jgi:hypothetical protein
MIKVALFLAISNFFTNKNSHGGKSVSEKKIPTTFLPTTANSTLTKMFSFHSMVDGFEAEVCFILLENVT